MKNPFTTHYWLPGDIQVAPSVFLLNIFHEARWFLFFLIGGILLCLRAEEKTREEFKYNLPRRQLSSEFPVLLVDATAFPIPSMYGIYTYIRLMFMVNVGKYTIHGWYGFVFYSLNLSVRPNRKHTSHWLGSGKEAFCVSFLGCYPLRGELLVSGIGYNEFHYIFNLGVVPPLPGFHWANAGLGPLGDSPNHLQTKSSCHPGGDCQHPHPGARARGKYQIPNLWSLGPILQDEYVHLYATRWGCFFFSSWRALKRAESQVSTSLGQPLFKGKKTARRCTVFFLGGGVEVVCEMQIFWVWNGWKVHSWQFCDRDPFRMVKWSFWMAKFIAKTQPLTTRQKPQVPNWNLFLDLN